MKSMRSYLEERKRAFPEDFVVVKDEVDPIYEITAIVKKLDLNGYNPILLFENVKGFSNPVICNVQATPDQLAFALGIRADQLEEYYDKVESGVMSGQEKYEIESVSNEQSPVKELKFFGKDINLYNYPFVTHHLGEKPYITRAIGITRDPENGLLHAGHYRLMISGKDRMVTHMTPGRHLWQIYHKASKMGIDLPIAFCIGCHPAWHMGAQSRVSHPPTELEIAGALAKEPLKVTTCEMSDLQVPAECEIVFEGVLKPGSLEPEGPWSDFTRYSQSADRHSVFINAITQRKDYIYEDAGAWLKAGLSFARIPQLVNVRRSVMKAVPNVKDFRFGFYPAQMFGFISLDKHHVSEPRHAILAAFAAEIYLKYVAVFDTDIDLSNPNEITWALGTRVQAERDFLILPGVLGSDLDISAPMEGMVTKVGIDATAKPFRKDMPEIGKINEEMMAKVDIKKFIKKI